MGKCRARPEGVDVKLYQHYQTHQNCGGIPENSTSPTLLQLFQLSRNRCLVLRVPAAPKFLVPLVPLVPEGW